MEHLDFINELDKLGISIHCTCVENKDKVIHSQYGKDRDVVVNNFNVKYINNSLIKRCSPIQSLIIEGIDIDEWKHSLHYNIEPKNYEKFREIIQDKIIERAKDIDTLVSVYSQLNHEMSNQ